MSLSSGKLENSNIICNYHGWSYSIADGVNNNEVNHKCNLNKYPLKVHNNFIYVGLNLNTEIKLQKTSYNTHIENKLLEYELYNVETSNNENYYFSNEPVLNTPIMKKDINLPWSYIMTNNLDNSHLHYVHSNSIGRIKFNPTNVVFNDIKKDVTYYGGEKEVYFQFIPPYGIYSYFKINSVKVFEQYAKIVPLTKYSSRVLYQQKFQNLPTISLTFSNIITGIIQEDISILEEQYNNHLKFLKKYGKEDDEEKNPNKIVILVFPKYIHIEFLQKKLEWIHKKLNITIPKKSDSSKGGIILNKDEISSILVI